jgi:hypothetical protein
MSKVLLFKVGNPIFKLSDFAVYNIAIIFVVADIGFAFI